MGTFKNGILGHFSGKVGAVIGSRWRGISVMKGLITTGKRKSNPALLPQQAKFALMIKFLQPLSSLVSQTYDKSPAEMTGMNKAFSDNIKNAITGVYPAITIDYTKVLLSKGSLPEAGSPAAAAAAAGKLVFTWVDNSVTGNGLASDKAFVAAYCELLNRWIFSQNTAARNAGTYTLDVPAFSGKPVQTYIGFISADGLSVSNSLYTGQVNVV
jgi:Family of unknown function (DUF6266)